MHTVVQDIQLCMHTCEYTAAEIIVAFRVKAVNCSIDQQ